MLSTMGLSHQKQQGKRMVLGHWKACNNRGSVRLGRTVSSCVTSLASQGLLRPICAWTLLRSHTHTHTDLRAGTRECKRIVNRKHAGIARDWEVILDRWPLDVSRFCFALNAPRKTFFSTVWLLPCKESWEIWVELLPLVRVFFY